MKLRKLTAPGYWQMEGVWRDRDRTRIRRFADGSHHPTYPHFCALTALTVAVSHANASKTGATKRPQVFDKHRGTERNGKFLLTYQDATNHATIEKLGGASCKSD